MHKATIVALLATGLLALSQSTPLEQNETKQGNDMWIAGIDHGISAFHGNPNDYKVYRNVMDFGCKADGVTDDTMCINEAISSGGRCGEGCGSSTLTPALVYFPSGTYLVSKPIIMFYFTQLVGNAKDLPVLKTSASFEGMAVIDSNPYGGGGNNWYTNQNNFFRQVRNFVIDTTGTPADKVTTGVHWQVAQATSLMNMEFKMPVGSAHQGIWMENGSGGFMSDLTFNGGKFGMWVGNQQFLSRHLVFNDCDTAIYMNWNWQWSFKNIEINNCKIGIDMSQGSDEKASGVGSIMLFDSEIKNTPIGVLLQAIPTPNRDDVSGTLLLDNVKVDNVPNVVQDTSGLAVLASSGSQTIPSWGRGSKYSGTNGGEGTFGQDYLPNVQKSGNLLDGQGNFYAKSRPQYEELGVGDFASVKEAGAKGDGQTDDADVIQRVINDNVNGKVVYIPAGTYILGKTVNIPAGTRIIGELWSTLMADGAGFKDENNPTPMLKVGEPGQSGSVQLTDLMFGVKGSQAGAVLVEWNLKESSQGSASMTDCHFRVGGTAGTLLQVAQCPKGQSAVPQCIAAHTLLKVTPTASGYFENVWAWTADHDLDNNLAQGQISIYVGRGVQVESTDGPVWLYGIQSEHNVLYQYQLDNAKNVFITMIQSETPYWQPGPPAPAPFTPSAALNDPTYDHCPAGDLRCPMSWSINAVGSSNVYIYGAGMYNFFNNYDQTCLDDETCQFGMMNLEGNSNFYMYNLNTKAAINMVVQNKNQVLAVALENSNGFCETINAFTL